MDNDANKQSNVNTAKDNWEVVREAVVKSRPSNAGNSTTQTTTPPSSSISSSTTTGSNNSQSF